MRKKPLTIRLLTMLTPATIASVAVGTGCYVHGAQYGACDISPPVPGPGRCIVEFTSNPPARQVSVQNQAGYAGIAHQWVKCQALDGSPSGPFCFEDTSSTVLTGGNVRDEWPCCGGCTPIPGGPPGGG